MRYCPAAMETDELTSSNSSPATTRLEFKRKRRRRPAIWALLLLSVGTVLLLAKCKSGHNLFAHSRPLSLVRDSPFSLGRRQFPELEAVGSGAADNVVALAPTSSSSSSSTSDDDPHKQHLAAVDGSPSKDSLIETRRLRRGAALDAAGGDEPASSQHRRPPTNSSSSSELKTRLQLAQQRLDQLARKYTTNRAINDTAYYTLLLVYSSLISFGTVSNSLICLTVSSDLHGEFVGGILWGFEPQKFNHTSMSSHQSIIIRQARH